MASEASRRSRKGSTSTQTGLVWHVRWHVRCAVRWNHACTLQNSFANAALPESEPAHDSGCHVRHTAISAFKRDLSCIYCVMASREHGTTETDHTTVDGPKEPPPRPCIQRPFAVWSHSVCSTGGDTCVQRFASSHIT